MLFSRTLYQFGCGISIMVRKNQNFWPKINILKGKKSVDECKIVKINGHDFSNKVDQKLKNGLLNKEFFILTDGTDSGFCLGVS